MTSLWLLSQQYLRSGDWEAISVSFNMTHAVFSYGEYVADFDRREYRLILLCVDPGPLTDFAKRGEIIRDTHPGRPI